jgi:hypothetical protein
MDVPAETTLEAYRVADETFVIPQLEMAPPVGQFYLNSMIIRGREPVIVDTGTPKNRATWLRQTWDLVDPADVRSVFISHDDRDHTGNLREVMEACPNAVLVTTWFQVGRMATDHEDGWMPPFDRMRWVYDGETLDVGDRTLAAVRPPFFDSPTTRGLFDPRTGCYWAADSFATVVQGPSEDVADLDADAWRDGLLLTNRLNHPWFIWVDEERFREHVARARGLGTSVIASCHSPTIYGAKVEEAFDLLLEIPRMPLWEEPTQLDLEAMVQEMAAGSPPS